MINMTNALNAPRKGALCLPVEVIFFAGPACVPLCSDEQQIEKSYETDHQADAEQLSDGRY